MASNHAKLFVGGLNRETNEDSLKLHFSKFGEVKETLIIMDKISGISRGFGFITFEDQSDADTAFRNQHVILGKKVDVKWATPMNQCDNSQEKTIENNGNKNDNEIEVVRTKKIFVGGLPHNTTNEEFENFFKEFGTIKDAIIIYNGATGRSRGFGFITFDSEDSADVVLQNRYHQFKDCQIEVKKAKPKSENDRQNAKPTSYYEVMHHYPYLNMPIVVVPYFIHGSQVPSWYSHQNNFTFSYYSNGGTHKGSITNNNGTEHGEKAHEQ